MLEAVARVLIWLAVGEVSARLGHLPIPGPVIGLILLYLDIARHERLAEDLGRLADGLLGALGLLFVPAGVGVVAHADLMRAEFVPILGAIVGGTVATLLATLAACALHQSLGRAFGRAFGARRGPRDGARGFGKAGSRA